MFFDLQVELVHDEDGSQRSEEPAIKLRLMCAAASRGWRIRTVEVNDELLSGGTDRDRASPLLIVVLVSELLRLALLTAAQHACLDVRREGCNLLDLSAL